MYFLKQWFGKIKKLLIDEEFGFVGFIIDLFTALFCLIFLPFVLIRDLLIYPIAYFISRMATLIKMPFTKHWVNKNLVNFSDGDLISFYEIGTDIAKKNYGKIMNSYNKKLLEDIKEYLKSKNLLKDE